MHKIYIHIHTYAIFWYFILTLIYLSSSFKSHDCRDFNGIKCNINKKKKKNN